MPYYVIKYNILKDDKINNDWDHTLDNRPRSFLQIIRSLLVNRYIIHTIFDEDSNNYIINC